MNVLLRLGTIRDAYGAMSEALSLIYIAYQQEEEDSRKRRQDRDRQVQERQRQLAKEREELQQRVLNKVKVECIKCLNSSFASLLR